MKALIAGLPADAALLRAMPEHGGWTLEHHLLATIADLLGITQYHALVGPHADAGRLGRVKPPPRIPRPGMKAPRRRATSEDLKRVFGGGQYRPREG